MSRRTRELIDDFLSRKRIAIAGVSTDPKDFSRTIYSEFKSRGYSVAAVNPNGFEIDGNRTVPRIQEVKPRPEAVLLMTSPSISDQIARDCAEVGVKLLWFYRAAGKGSVSASAIEFCKQNDIEAVVGHCPLMFFPDAGLVHRFHGLILKVFGSYPR